eukprot:6195148-Pleurochrysis_carterae.AAC.1
MRRPSTANVGMKGDSESKRSKSQRIPKKYLAKNSVRKTKARISMRRASRAQTLASGLRHTCVHRSRQACKALIGRQQARAHRSR